MRAELRRVLGVARILTVVFLLSSPPYMAWLLKRELKLPLIIADAFSALLFIVGLILAVGTLAEAGS